MNQPEPTLSAGIEPAPALSAVKTARRLLEAMADTSVAIERDQLHGQIWALRRLEHELRLRLEASWGLAPRDGDAA